MAARMELVRIEGALFAIGGDLDYPSSIDLSSEVRRRLASQPRRRPVFRLRSVRLPVLRPPAVFRPVWQVAVAAVVAILVVFSGVLAASPSVRQAVERWLGLRGVRIVQTPPPSTPSVRPSGRGLDLGSKSTFADAQRHLGQRILLPAGLGAPDEVWVHDLSVGGVEVFLVYRPAPGLPVTSQTGVGLLLSEFTGDLYRPGLEKFGQPSQIRAVRVNGDRGFWIEGAHGVTYLDANGNVVPDELRLAGNVLLWQHGTLTLRMESALARAGAVVLAKTVR